MPPQAVRRGARHPLGVDLRPRAFARRKAPIAPQARPAGGTASASRVQREYRGEQRTKRGNKGETKSAKGAQRKKRVRTVSEAWPAEG